MMFLETPEGAYLSIDSIVGVAPRTADSEFDDTIVGAVILLSSGVGIETDETVERIMHQIGEAITFANEE